MGKTCCNYKDTDSMGLNFGQKPMKMEDPAMKELLDMAKQNEEKIVKIQSAFRGQAVRKEYSKN